MTRDQALSNALQYFNEGDFLKDLKRRVKIKTESQIYESRKEEMAEYITEMTKTFESLDYETQVFENPSEKAGPFFFAERKENSAWTTVLMYGHGDVIRGQEDTWREGLNPWTITVENDKIYGRGSADNKGQHTVNIGALQTILKTRGYLGFNSKILIEMGEESGSPGLGIFAKENKHILKADVLISSDGPRLRPDTPTLFMGSRGSIVFDIEVNLRNRAHHSGNWGGLIANPALILSNALASIADKRGQIKINEWRPNSLNSSIKNALADCQVVGGVDGPDVEPDWGEKSLTPAERVFGWNSFEILAFTAGTPERPVNAIPGMAKARCQLRFVVGTDVNDIIPALKRHLHTKGFYNVSVTPADRGVLHATRLEPDNPWVRWAASSIKITTNKNTAILPNIGGGLPNDVFSETLGLPTLWVPHSYASCAQHAPDEHILIPIMKEGLLIMTGLFWDIGDRNFHLS